MADESMRNINSSSTLEKTLRGLVREKQDLIARMAARDLGMELMRHLITALPDPSDFNNSFRCNDANAKKKKTIALKKIVNIISGDGRIDVTGITDSFGRTPLHYLCRYKGGDLEQLLNIWLSKFPDTEKKCSRGYTPVLMLCDEPNPAALKVLLSNGADVTSPRTRFTGSSPLLLACYELRRSSLRNSPNSRLHSITVTTLTYHIDMVLGECLSEEEGDARGESVLSVIKSSSSVYSAVVNGLNKAYEQRIKVLKQIRKWFKHGYEVLFDMILCYLHPPFINMELLRMLENQRPQRQRPYLKKSMSMPAKTMLKKPVKPSGALSSLSSVKAASRNQTIAPGRRATSSALSSSSSATPQTTTSLNRTSHRSSASSKAPRNRPSNRTTPKSTLKHHSLIRRRSFA